MCLRGKKKRKVKGREHPIKQCWKTGNNGQGEGWGTQLLLFVSVFKGTLSSHISWADGQQDGSWGSKVFARVSEDQVHNHLMNLNVQMSMGSNGRHPRVLRKLTDVVVRHSPWLLKSQGALVKSQQTEKRETLYPSLKRVERRTLGITNLLALPLCPGRSWNKSS